MRVPSIHLNGTSKEELVKQLCDAAWAVHTARKAVGNACPNGRDYYVQGPEAINEALAAHRARLKKLDEVYAELQQIAEAIP